MNRFVRRHYDMSRGYSESLNAERKLGKSVRHCARVSMKDWKTRFQQVRFLSAEEKTVLIPMVQRHVFWVSWIEYMLLERALVFMGEASTVILSAAFILSLFFPQYGDIMTYGPWVLLLAVSFGMTQAASRLLVLTLPQMANYLGYMESKRRYWWIGLFFYFSAVYIDPGYPFQPKTSFGDASGWVAFFLGLFAGIWLYIHGLIWANASIQRERIALRPQSFLVDRYQRLLVLMDENPTFLDRTRSSPRREFMAMLEEAACVLDRGWAQVLASGDATTDAWTIDRATHKANALRGLKKWVIAPKPDTFDQLKTRLITDLTSVATGNWEALPEDEMPTAVHTPWWVKPLTLGLRGLIIASVVLLATHSTKLEPKWVASNYTFILIGFPLLVTLLNRFDPLISPAIASYKDALTTFKSLHDMGKH